MLIIEPVRCVGAPRNLPERTLVLELLLMAVHGSFQGRGLGTKLVEHAKAIARAHAASRGIAALHMIVQADNIATGFWRKRGFQEGQATHRLVLALARWWPKENIVYLGATPMGIRETLNAHAPAEDAPAANDADAGSLNHMADEWLKTK